MKQFTYIFAIVLSLPIKPALANDTVYKFEGSGQTVVPAQNDSIEMKREQIIMTLDEANTSWSVHCEFELHNSGEAADVIIGFPDERIHGDWKMASGEAEEVGTRNRWALRDFMTVVEGATVAVKHVEVNKDSTAEAAYVWTMRFDPNETKTIRNSYTIGLGERHMVALGARGESTWDFTYVVRTGARWKGKIGRGEFLIDLHNAPHSALFYISPKPQLVAKGVYRFSLSNFEPDFDIKVGGFHVSGTYSAYSRMVFDGVVEPGGGLAYLRTGGVDTQSVLKWAEASDAYTISLFRNFVFALYGRTFTTTWLRDYFGKQQWYKPDPLYSDAWLSQEERALIEQLHQIEKSKIR